MFTVDLNGGRSGPTDLDLNSSATPGKLHGFDQVTPSDPTSASSSVNGIIFAPLDGLNKPWKALSSVPGTWQKCSTWPPKSLPRLPSVEPEGMALGAVVGAPRQKVNQSAERGQEGLL